MIVYKLTTQDNKTRKGCANETVWGRGVTHTAKGSGGLCSDGVIHGYTSPLLAVLMNPNHANIQNPKLWEAEMEVTANDRGLKIGGKTMTTIREIDLPDITNRQKIIFAILCAKAGFEAFDSMKSRILDERAAERYIESRQKYEAWAEAYIRGETSAISMAAYAAYAAANAANAAAYAATAAYAAYAAANAANAAAYAAYAAAYAAANAANAAYAAANAANAAAYAATAAYAAYAAANAANAAAYAAYAAAYAAPLDLDKLALLAMELGAEKN